jgi:polyhydroxybutyrate depolymerase
MNSFKLAALVAIALRLPLTLDADAADTPLPSPAKPGRFTLTLTSKDKAFDRTAQVHVPRGYNPGSKPPLVLALHGAGGNGSGILDADGWAAKADKEGFVVVAPEGLPARPAVAANFRTNPQVWNSGQLRAGSPRAAIDDLAFVRQLLDELLEKISYDERRVFCTGHSNGGGMTFRLAAELSERFTAVGTVAGMLAVDDPRPKKPLPTLYILGTKDPLMPIDGGTVKLPWGTRENPPVGEPLAAWAAALGCQTEPQTVSEKDGVKTVQYPSKNGGPKLVVLYLEGHGHHWPGGARMLPERLIGPTTTKLDATDTLWDFFESCADQPPSPPTSSKKAS